MMPAQRALTQLTALHAFRCMVSTAKVIVWDVLMQTAKVVQAIIQVGVVRVSIIMNWVFFPLVLRAKYAIRRTVYIVQIPQHSVSSAIILSHLMGWTMRHAQIVLWQTANGANKMPQHANTATMATDKIL